MKEKFQAFADDDGWDEQMGAMDINWEGQAGEQQHVDDEQPAFDPSQPRYGQPFIYFLAWFDFNEYKKTVFFSCSIF